MTYAEKLRHPKWQRKRLEILDRDGYMCQECGETEQELQIHHKHYNFNLEPWEYKNKDLITLCKDCHKTMTECNKEIIFIVRNYQGIENLVWIKRIMRVLNGKTPDILKSSYELLKKHNG